MLLSSLDETVIQHGAEFNLGLHKYQGNNFSPNGHKYIREFDCEHIPATTYRVGGVILRKEKIFVEDEEIEVIDSFFQSAPADARPLWFLGKSLELLSTADIAYFAKGWENARGCRIENTCAIEYGIDVIEDYTED